MINSKLNASDEILINLYSALEQQIYYTFSSVNRSLSAMKTAGAYYC